MSTSVKKTGAIDHASLHEMPAFTAFRIDRSPSKSTQVAVHVAVLRRFPRVFRCFAHRVERGSLLQKPYRICIEYRDFHRASPADQLEYAKRLTERLSLASAPAVGNA
jgi:hypothetical protein